MIHPIFDSTLALPRPASDPGIAAPPEGGLVRSGRADDRTHYLSGARATVALSGTGGLLSTNGGHRLTGPIRIVAHPAATLEVTPRTATRHRRSPALDERIVVPERLPGAAVQWVGAPARADVTLEVDLPLSPTAPYRIQVDGPLLRWAAADSDRGAVLQLVGPGAEKGWRLVQAPTRFVARAVIQPADDAAVTLLVAEVGDDGRLPSLAALAVLHAHLRRDALEPDEAPGIVVSAGHPALGEGVGWARAALRSRVDEGSAEIRGGARAALMRGALAAGERSVARAALPGPATTLDDAEALALWVAWTGRGQEFIAARNELDRLAADAPAPLRRQLADAAEAAGEEEWARQLRLPHTAPGSRTLPTLGPTPAVKPVADPPSALESGQDAPTPDELVGALRRVAGEAAGWSAAVVERAVTAQAEGRASAAGLEAPLALDLLVRGLLGVRPDATYGRIEVAPVLPSSWMPFRIDGLAVGDAQVGFEMRREGDRARFILRQTAGGAPVTWVFAPRLEGTAVTGAWVDGTLAQIDATRAGDRIQPRVQLPGERERVVELEITPP